MANFNLAFVVSQIFEFGGMQRSLLRIARECSQRGNKVDIYTGKWEVPDEPSLNIFLLDIKATTNHGKMQKLAKIYSEKFRCKNYHCIIGFNKLPGLDVYYAGDPCLAAKVADEKPTYYRFLPRYKSYLKLESAVFKEGLPTEILLIAHREKEKFIRYYGTEEKRFHLLPPGINRDLFLKNVPSREERKNLRRSLGIGSNEFFVLLVGSGFRTKGVDRAIEGLCSLPANIQKKCWLIVIGKGDPKPFIKLASQRGVSQRISFLGPKSEVAPYFYSSDVLIHPAYTENTGTTLLEAMVCGLPVLTVENCGFSDHVKKAKAGLVCPTPFEQNSLNKLFVEMLVSDQRNQWKRNALEYCKKTDLYGLIDIAADKIINRAQKNSLPK